MALPWTSFKLRNRSLESCAANSANMSGPSLSRSCRTSRAAFGGWMTAACAMASVGSCVQVRHGATCRRPMVPAGLVTIASFGGCWTYLADLPDVSNVDFGTDECRLLCMGLFSIFWLGAPRRLRVLPPPPEGCIIRSGMMRRRVAWNRCPTSPAAPISSPAPRARTHCRRLRARSSAHHPCPRCRSPSRRLPAP